MGDWGDKMSGLWLPLGALIISVFLVFMFFSKENTKNSETKIWTYIKWDNILESTTNSYSGDVCLNSNSSLYFRPTNAFDSATDSNNSYFKLSCTNNTYNTISYNFYYNKNDIDIIYNKFKSTKDLPSIYIYKSISKCGYYYNLIY